MGECTGRVFLKNNELIDTTQFDGSFLSGTAYIYEVFRVIDGIPLFLEDHLERLCRSVALTGNSLPLTEKEIQQLVFALVDANELPAGNIKIAYIPSDGATEDLFQLYITPHQYPDARQFREGIAVALFDGSRQNPNAKVMDAALRTHTNQMKSAQNVYETLLVDQEGYITEGSRSNVFFVVDNDIITPPMEDVLPGITRKYVIECCRKEGVPLREERMHVSEIHRAQAAFLSGTSRKVLPINRINDNLYDPSHDLIRIIQHAFNNVVTIYLLKERRHHI